VSSNIKRFGFCSFCGKEGLNLFPLILKKTFTRADYLHDTGLICPACKHLYETQEYRKKNWIITKREFSFLKKEEVLSRVVNIRRADLPFVLYSTKTYKKQGWLNLLNTLNYSIDSFIIAYDMQLIHFTRNKLLEYKEKAEYYRSKKITKNELITGILKNQNYTVFENPLKEEKYLKKRKGNINWLWVINFVK